jgi:hypothetical protein
MLGLFSRPVRRPRNVQSQLRTRLRLESLEGRAVPAALTTNLATSSWTPGSTLVLTGKVQDDSDTGASSGQTTDTTAASGGTAAAPGRPGGGQQQGVKPLLQNVTVTQTEDGVWHIRGHVDGASPVGTIVEVVNGPGNSTGATTTVDADGNFDIGIVLDPGTPGGSISIDAVNQTTGNHSDPWSGLIG